MASSSCHGNKEQIDYLLWGSLSLIIVFYIQFAFLESSTSVASWYHTLTA